MNIAIIGYGYVGKAFYEYFKQKYRVIVFDPYYSETVTKDEVNKSDLAVICVPTPSNEDGSCNISIVEESIEWIETPLIVIKSTVSIGTTDMLREKYKKNIVFSPEYIGESDYDTGKFDFNKSINKMDYFIFGGDREITSKIVNIYSKISGPNKKYIQTDTKSAEITKYMENSFLATKLIFCYEMDQICKAHDSDYNTVRELWLMDPRMGSSHTIVFNDKINPYDGKCLPKDIKALVKSAEEVNYDSVFLKEVIKSNDRLGDMRKSS